MAAAAAAVARCAATERWKQDADLGGGGGSWYVSRVSLLPTDHLREAGRPGARVAPPA
jgi:hypothetical protein